MYARGSHPSDNDVGGEEERKRSKKIHREREGFDPLTKTFV